LTTDFGSKYNNDPELQNQVNEIFEQCLDSSDPVTYMVNEINKLINPYLYNIFITDGVISGDRISPFRETDDNGEVVYSMLINGE
jgi:hypothetical protein